MDGADILTTTMSAFLFQMLTDSYLILMVFVLVFLNAVILIVWEVIDPMKVNVRRVEYASVSTVIIMRMSKETPYLPISLPLKTLSQSQSYTFVVQGTRPILPELCTVFKVW